MNIQSLSVVVPTKGCINKCKFCVSRMHNNSYETYFDESQIRKRLRFAANNGVNTLILTGTGEVLQNTKFLYQFQEVLYKEGHPFPNVELQTSGVMLMDQNEAGEFGNITLLKLLGVNTISLSVSDIFDSDNNWDIIGAPEKYRPPLTELCQFIKEHHFNLRLSLNMTNIYDEKSPREIINACKYIGADQITFRKLYHSGDNSEQSNWVSENSCDADLLHEIFLYIDGRGNPLYRLPFGSLVYSIDGMSVAIDDNCMADDELEILKYVILRENGKLYCKWDDEGSLIF